MPRSEPWSASSTSSTSATPVPDRKPIDPAPAPPADLNFVVVLLDDGGAEWFDWSGLVEPNSDFAVHPRLSEMRQRGVAFTRAYACPICAPTRARLWSSQYGFDAGTAANPTQLDDFAFGGGGAPLDAWQDPPPITLKLLPRLLSLGRDGSDELPLNKATYAQASFGKSHLHSDAGRETWPCDHGLGRYVGCQPNAGVLPKGDSNTGHFHFTEIEQTAGGAPTAKVWGSPGTWPAGGPYVAYDVSGKQHAGWDAYVVYRNAISWINSRTKPFLALVNFNPPHAPFEVPPFKAPDDVGHAAPGGLFDLVSPATETAMIALDGGGKGPGYSPPSAGPDVFAESRKAVYRANLEAVDTLIGKLWDRMEPSRRDKTVFLVMGDNGTVANCVEAPYEGTHAKRSPYEQGARVPCVVWGPPSVVTSPNRTCDHLLHVVDVMPTILELARADPALWNQGGTRKVRGKTFAPVLRDPTAPPSRDHVYNEVFTPLEGTRDGPVPIDASRWVQSYTDGLHKIIQRPGGVFEFYRIDAAPQPASGAPGYFEKPADNLYPLVGQPGQGAITAAFDALKAALDALVAS